MNRLDRVLSTWGSTPRVGVGDWTVLVNHIFLSGRPFACRVRDANGKQIIFVRDDYDPALNPERNFKKKKWFAVPAGNFITISANVATIDQVRGKISSGWTGIDYTLLTKGGTAVIEIARQAQGLDIDLIGGKGDEDDIIAGARYFMRGRDCEAICYSEEVVGPEPRGGKKLTRPGRKTGYYYADVTATCHHVLFKKMDDAVLYMLSNNGIRLFELT